MRDDGRPVLVAIRWKLGAQILDGSSIDHICAQCYCTVVTDTRSQLMLAAGEVQGVLCVECVVGMPLPF